MNHFNAAKVYELPDEIAKRSDWLLKAHVDALKYNSRTVRLDDLKECGNQVMLTYSNVTYWDLLMTNRAMDYEWEDGRKTRDVYEQAHILAHWQVLRWHFLQQTNCIRQ